MAWHFFVLGFLLLTTIVANSSSQTSTSRAKPSNTRVGAVEVFQVIDLPLSIRNVELLKTEKGYQLKGLLSNNADEQMIGLRYSLVEADGPVPQLVSNRVEALKLNAYSSQQVRFEYPLKLSWHDGMRLVLMLEQAFTTHDIWEVMKPREALEAYIAADFSVVPKVIHAPNHTDSPMPARRLIY